MTRLLTTSVLFLFVLFFVGDPLVDSAPQADKPELVSQAFRYDGQPAIAVDAEGRPWVAWVGFEEEKGDVVLCSRLVDGAWTKPEEVSGRTGNYVRPTIAATADRVVVVWTATTEVKTSLWMSVHHGGEWSSPVQVSPHEGVHQNAELCADAQGRLWMAWQGLRAESYDIFLASFDGEAWSDPIAVCADPGNDWDPVVAADSQGRVHVAWSGFREADYDVFLRTLDGGKLGDEARLTDHEAYDLHPWIAVDAKDRVWACWDRVSVPRHAGSGGTTIVGKDAEAEPEHGRRPDAWIEVRCLDGARRLAPADDAVKVPKGYRVLHCGYPKLAVDASGGVWLVHRALTNAAGGAAGKKQKGAKEYWWDVLAYSYDGDSWSEPRVLERSDGYLEESGVAVSSDRVWVAHSMEHRAPWAEDGSEDDHHKGQRPLGRNGDVLVTALAPSDGAEPSLVEATALAEGRSALAERLVPRSEAEHAIEQDGTTYTLLFGDLHKHSNVSRCSGGSEPSLDDHYRYSHDVCQYDFMMMSDHSQHTTDFNWWKLQKLADLYYVPGWFVTLFGYEASLKFPYGHRNLVFPERPAPIVRPGVDGATSGEAIWKALGGVEALTIPHTSADPGMGTDWSEHDAEYERLVEMFQACRGSYEHEGCPRQHGNATNQEGFVWNALAKGYRLGFICSTDHGYGVSYACVYAKEKTREGVYEALHERRCYGSTAYGIVLDVRSDGHLMGTEYADGDGAALAIHARGYAPIRSVEVISNGKVVQSWGSAEEPLGEREVDLSWKDKPRAKLRYYYVRLILSDDEMAWSSPIWVHPAE